MNNDFNQDYLMHYGVLGMKWGVRRYENKGGNYTKRGLKKFKASEEKYNAAKQNYKVVKSSVKETKKNGYTATSNGDKIAVMPSAKREAKQAVRSAKKDMDRSYKQLKKDYKADQGKELYSQGKTIQSISTRDLFTYLGIAAATELSAVSANAHGVTFTNRFGTIPLSTIIYGVGSAAIIGSTIKNERDKSKIRAYYAH